MDSHSGSIGNTAFCFWTSHKLIQKICQFVMIFVLRFLDQVIMTPLTKMVVSVVSK